MQFLRTFPIWQHSFH